MNKFRDNCSQDLEWIQNEEFKEEEESDFEESKLVALKTSHCEEFKNHEDFLEEIKAVGESKTNLSDVELKISSAFTLASASDWTEDAEFLNSCCADDSDSNCQISSQSSNLEIGLYGNEQEFLSGSESGVTVCKLENIKQEPADGMQTLYVCEFDCGFSSTSMKQLYEHASTIHQSGSFKQNFSESSLTSVMNDVETSQFNCTFPMCMFSTCVLQDLEIHVVDHHKEQENSFASSSNTSEEANATFDEEHAELFLEKEGSVEHENDESNNHWFNEIPVRKKTYCCLYCDFLCEDLIDLKKHVNICFDKHVKNIKKEVDLSDDMTCPKLQEETEHASDIILSQIKQEPIWVADDDCKGICLKDLETSTFSCDCCDFVTVDKEIFQEHLKIHCKGSKEICSEEQKKSSVFKLADDESDDIKPKICCPFCDLELYSLKEFKQHVKLKHTMNICLRRFVCSSCHEESLSKTYMACHCRIRHLDEKAMVLETIEELSDDRDINDFVMDNKKELRSVCGSSTEVKSYQCNHCSFSTDIHGMLSLHERLHVNKRNTQKVQNAGWRTQVNVVQEGTIRSAEKKKSSRVSREEKVSKNNSPDCGNYYTFGSPILSSKLGCLYSSHGGSQNCKVCKYTCKQEWYIHRHILEYHVLVRFWQCKYCMFQKLFRNQVLKHCSAVHKTEKPSAFLLDEPDWDTCLKGAVDKIAQMQGKPADERKILVKMKSRNSILNTPSKKTQTDHYFVVESSHTKEKNTLKLKKCISVQVGKQKFSQKLASLLKSNEDNDKDISRDLETDKRMKLVGDMYKIKSNCLYKCFQCNYECVLHTKISAHIWSEHMKKTMQKCEHCQYRTWLHGSMVSHLESRHAHKLHPEKRKRVLSKNACHDERKTSEARVSCTVSTGDNTSQRQDKKFNSSDALHCNVVGSFETSTNVEDMMEKKEDIVVEAKKPNLPTVNNTKKQDAPAICSLSEELQSLKNSANSDTSKVIYFCCEHCLYRCKTSFSLKIHISMKHPEVNIKPAPEVLDLRNCSNKKADLLVLNADCTRVKKRKHAENEDELVMKCVRSVDDDTVKEISSENTKNISGELEADKLLIEEKCQSPELESKQDMLSEFDKQEEELKRMDLEYSEVGRMAGILENESGLSRNKLGLVGIQSMLGFSETDEKMQLIGNKVRKHPLGEYQCPFCQLTHLLEDVVRIHIWTFHMKLVPHCCRFCTFKAWFSSLVWRHEICKHPNDYAENKLVLETRDEDCKRLLLDGLTTGFGEKSSRMVDNADKPSDCVDSELSEISEETSKVSDENQDCTQGDCIDSSLANCDADLSSLKVIEVFADFMEFYEKIHIKCLKIAGYKEQFNCAVCYFKTMSKSKIVLHSSQHAPIVFECLYCQYKACHRKRLLKHIRENHSKPPVVIVLHDVPQLEDKNTLQLSNEPISQSIEDPVECKGACSLNNLNYLCCFCLLETTDFSEFAYHLGLHNMYQNADSGKTLKASEQFLFSRLVNCPFHCVYCGQLGRCGKDIHKHSLKEHPSKPLKVSNHCSIKDKEILMKRYWKPVEFDVKVQLEDFQKIDDDEFQKLIVDNGLKTIRLPCWQYRR